MTEVLAIQRRRVKETESEWNTRVAEIRDRLGRELEDLSNEVMPGINRRLASAGGEPGAAQGSEPIHRRIHLLGQLIAGLEAAEPGTLWDDRAGYGSTVFLRDLDSGEETFCTLMAGSLIDDAAGQVPLGSALGRALLGCRAGDEPVVEMAQGTRRLRVFAVHTLPQSLGMADAGPHGAA